MSSSQSLVGLAVVLVQRWKTVIAGTIMGAAAAAVLAVALGPTYTAESSFMPESGDASMARVSGLAAQLGLNVGAPAGGESIDFYASLISSKSLLRAAVTSHYAVPASAKGWTLVEIYGIDEDTDFETMNKAVDRLSEAISVTTQMDANLVALKVSASSPSLAVQLNQRLLELVRTFNLQKRQSRAAAERTFIETRLEGATADLRAAEQELQAFLEQNRGYENSPELRFRVDRLQRTISLRQQVYTSLAEAYEQARIEEVRNTPVLTIIEAPEMAVRRAGLRLPSALIPGAILGLILAVVLAFWRDYWARQQRENPRDYERWRTSIRTTMGEWKQGWRRKPGSRG